MTQSLSKINIHLIFHVKNNRCLINECDEERLYQYMGSIIKDNHCIPVEINGVEDHVHCLFVMSKNIALSKITEEIKRHSSRWMKEYKPYYRDFSWQGGYGGFSVSPSLLESTKRYIQNQKGHHRKVVFKEEYVMFLKKYGIDFDERYLWTD